MHVPGTFSHCQAERASVPDIFLPFPHRVWLTLVEKGLSFDTIKVELFISDASFSM